MNFFWGDIHNHNDLGYGVGSAQRSLEIARGRLDFWAPTPHGQVQGWKLLGDDESFDDRVARGMRRTRDQWSHLQELVEQANEPSRFVTFLGYEWHSSRYGDHVLLYPHARGSLVYFDDIPELQAYAKANDCLLIPHHLGYRGPGGAGHDWTTHDPMVTPVVELYSEHGASERDRGPFAMVRHSAPGRATQNCAQAALAAGLRFGFVASTDGHLGCPGAYGEGLVGAYAEELTREAIWDALRARCTIAVTGDRIETWLQLNGQPVGSILPWTPERDIEISVTGWDEIDRVELIRNNQVMDRFYPRATGDAGWPGRARCRIECGWGRWTGSHERALTEWSVAVQIEGGRLLGAMPCLQSRPFFEAERPAVRRVSESCCLLEAHTVQRHAVESIQCFEDSNAQGMVLDIEGPSAATLSIEVHKPVVRTFQVTLADLARQSVIEPTGPLVGESVVVHRLVLPHEYTVQARLVDSGLDPQCTDFYYVRATQANGQMAWTSPIWVREAA